MLNKEKYIIGRIVTFMNHMSIYKKKKFQVSAVCYSNIPDMVSGFLVVRYVTRCAAKGTSLYSCYNVRGKRNNLVQLMLHHNIKKCVICFKC